MNTDKSIIRKYNVLYKEKLPLIFKIFWIYCTSCKILVVGGGTAGCSMAAKLSRKLDKPNQVIVLEPSDVN